MHAVANGFPYRIQRRKIIGNTFVAVFEKAPLNVWHGAVREHGL